MIGKLTNSQFEVLELIAQGYTNPQIMQKLYISEGSLKDRIDRIFHTLQAKNRTHAVHLAWVNGLFKSESAIEPEHRAQAIRAFANALGYDVMLRERGKV